MALENDVFNFKVISTSVVNFILVYTEEDLEKRNVKCVFKPEMSHQIFGENETIFGYKDLCINLYFHHNSFKCYLDVKYAEVIENFTPDNIIEALNPWLPTGYTEKLDVFKKIISNEKHDEIFGELVHKFERKIEVPAFRECKELNCTYKITLCDTKSVQFQEYHQRFETLIIWQIDAANFIDLDDERWMIFYLYEEFKHPDTDEIIVTPIGFSTIYKFFSYPSSSRARISQFFIIPTYQKRGFGSELYKAIHEYLSGIEDIVDITVEEPNESFQRMRDICDALYIQEDLKKNNENIAVKSAKLLNNYMAKHKICKKQALKISDILQCFTAVKSGENEVKKFEDAVYKRIKGEIEREFQTLKKARGLYSEEIQGDDVMMNESLHSKHRSYLEEIKYVVGKLQLKF